MRMVTMFSELPELKDISSGGLKSASQSETLSTTTKDP